MFPIFNKPAKNDEHNVLTIENHLKLHWHQRSSWPNPKRTFSYVELTPIVRIATGYSNVCSWTSVLTVFSVPNRSIDHNRFSGLLPQMPSSLAYLYEFDCSVVFVSYGRVLTQMNYQLGCVE